MNAQINDEYEDKEGENLFPEAQEPHTTKKSYKCAKCGKVKMEKSTNLFPPFCHGHPMKFIHVIENKFDFKTLTRRLIKENKAKKKEKVKKVKLTIKKTNCKAKQLKTRK